jgi:hypothetical protein
MLLSSGLQFVSILVIARSASCFQTEAIRKKSISLCTDSFKDINEMYKKYEFSYLISELFFIHLVLTFADRGCHVVSEREINIVWTIVSQMEARLSILRTGRSLLPRNIFFASGTHFCQRLSEPQGLLRPEGLGKLKKFIHLIGSQTRNLSACSLVSYSLRYSAPVR